MAKTYARNVPKKGDRSSGRTTRSKKSKQLTNGLEDPAQVERDLNSQLKAMGLYAANTIGDGNCLFRALSDQMFGYPELHSDIRKQICDFISEHQDRFSGFVDGSFEQYIRSMRENGTYGGHLELSAFAQLNMKHIKVVQPGLVYVVSGVDESPDVTLAREKKEEERRTAQEALAPGTEAPPPSERARRRLRREAKMKKSASSMSDATAVSTVSLATQGTEDGEPEDRPEPRTAPIEAWGPLYIAYHNWEHYSSIRNIEGPHSGLPRIQEHAISEAGSSEPLGPVQPAREVEGPSHLETMIMHCCPGHQLEEVRRLLRETGDDFEGVVEILIAKDAEEEQELDQSSPVALKDRADSNATNWPSISQPLQADQVLVTLPGRCDHLRDWRAESPSSVETAATHSSADLASLSTHATTDEAGTGASSSAEASSNGGHPGRSGKRAASSDPMTRSIFREPKRTSPTPQGGAGHVLSDNVTLIPENAEQDDGSGSAEVSFIGIRRTAKVDLGKPTDDQELAAAASCKVSLEEPVKRGRGRPKGSGKRVKREEVRAKRRDKEIAKALVRKAGAQPSKLADPVHAAARPTTEVRSFRELHI